MSLASAMNEAVTTVICARNAAATIARAVASAAGQGGPVILVDDWSTDATSEVARSVAGVELTVVVPVEHRTLGFARQTGAEAVRTPWLVWLDADDEFLPGRVARLRDCAVRGRLDAVWDGAQLWDGPTGRFLRNLPVPSFMLRDGAAVRLFERNFIPGPAWPLVRTSVAREIGYDADLPTGDDLDFMLRAIRSGHRLGFIQEIGYRQFAYATSLSRDLSHQRRWVAHVLRKHAYEDVRACYLAGGLGARLAAWGLVSMALFREDAAAALTFIDEASPSDARGDEVLEPDGPWPFPEGWRRAFQRGTCLALVGGRDDEAAGELKRAQGLDSTPEAANNLGVVLFRLADIDAARGCWVEAERQFPGYLDAVRNLENPSGNYITTHPLRRQASRSEY